MILAALFLAAVLLVSAMMMAGFFVLQGMHQRERLSDRLLMIQGRPRRQGEQTERESLRVVVIRALSGFGQAILRSGMVSSQTLKDVQQTLEASGLRGSQGVGIFIASKIVLALSLPLLAWLATSHVTLPHLLHMLLLPATAVAGLMLPDILVGKQRKRYLARLEQGLPDALDMLVICTQAGLALGPSIIRVGVELQHSYKEIATEFELTANELQVNADSRVALQNLGQRSGLEGFKRLATTLVQTIQYGTPIADALRLLSAEMRQEALIAFEGRAARLPVMLTMPMIAFILPCIFLIVGGPAMIEIMKAFTH